ncbi:hypothetical protein BKG70_00770 [Mycobacteroides chelonae]|uniref:hypothetical protein n=1 Tax=Mycobacteroides chelonae TaxID=1774 RepID=UPI0008A94B95|nr:hypothetical protein [Mycobacteroides chelonae]OHT91299.1 hypothetical protein BKG70_00770 [Mycobacteroides chelonae]
MGIEVQKARGNEITYRTPSGPIHIKAWDDRAGIWYLALNAPDRYPDGSRKQNTRTLCIGSQPRVDIEAFVQAFAMIYEAASGPKAPRKLESLDCEESRDGTVWADSAKHTTWRYRFNGVWEYTWADKHSRSNWEPLTEMGLLTSAGPYTEVVE